MPPSWSPPSRQLIGRYALCDEIASGGMASVHVGRLLGPSGFARTVAIKRLHPQLARDPEFVAMLLDEACLIARVRHPNVIPVLDVVSLPKELLLVMDYVHGESLDGLCAAARKRGTRLPPRFAAAIVAGALNGLHAAHEAVNEQGEPLRIVHRDVSPNNILVGVDGVARVFDFGIAHASRRVQITKDGQIKGTLPYMSPEHVRGLAIDRRADIFAAGAVLWEALTGQRRFVGDNAAVVMTQILEATDRPPSTLVPGLPRALDSITRRALCVAPENRFATARDMAMALEEVFPSPTPRELGEWVESMVGPALAKRSASVHDVESDPALARAGSAEGASDDGELATCPGTGARAAGRNVASEPESEESTSSVAGSGSGDAGQAPHEPEAPRPAAAPKRSRLLVAGLIVAALAGLLSAPAVCSRFSAPDKPLGALGQSTALASSARQPSPEPSAPLSAQIAALAPSTEPVVSSAHSASPVQRDAPPSPALPASGIPGATGGGRLPAALSADARAPDKGATPDDCASNPFTYATVGGKLIKRPRPECFAR